MPVVICEKCQRRVNVRLTACPRCGAARLRGHEWRSEAEWMGQPLVHVAYGLDEKGVPLVASGIVAIGHKARGWIAIGIIAQGFLAIGVLAFGVFSIGVVAVGAVLGLGLNAFGYMAFGVFAAGWKAGGVAAFAEHVVFSKLR